MSLLSSLARRPCSLFHGIWCAVLRDPTLTLTTDMLMKACNELQPTLLDSVPWLLEDMLKRLDGGDESARCLTRLAAVMAGGAVLNEDIAMPIARRHGVTVLMLWGQTEACGGVVLLGGLESDVNAMRHMSPARTILVDGDGNEAEDEGELVLLGQRSATAGYLGVQGGHSLTGEFECPTCANSRLRSAPRPPRPSPNRGGQPAHRPEASRSHFLVVAGRSACTQAISSVALDRATHVTSLGVRSRGSATSAASTT